MCRPACLYDVPRDYRTWSPRIKRLNEARTVAVESPMTAKWPLPFVLVLGMSATRAAGPTVTIDTASPAGKVSPLFYGLMTEEINHAYNGGLYAELVRNRAFLDDPATPAHWSLVQTDGSAATMALDPKEALNTSIGTSLRLNVTQAATGHAAGITNEGYWGIPVKPNTRYRASFYAKAAPGFTGPVAVSIQSDDGRTIYATKTVSGLTSSWKQYELTLQTDKVTPTAKARYVLTVERPGTLWFSLVSLFPPTFKDQPNGFRPDIMQMMVDMKPKFLRFPGGNYLEGDQIADRFEWKKTIGPLSDRPGHMAPWGYRSTDGLGLHEFLLWCEDMNAEPLLAVYAGYSLKGVHVNPGPDLEPYVQDALDEIEYVTGPATSKWGSLRAKAGHPTPFKLTYVEVGNEDWFDKSGSYDQRFVQFNTAIKARYPQLKVISTVGFEQPEGLRVHSVKPDVLDEHYYRTVDVFLKMARGQYEKYRSPRPGDLRRRMGRLRNAVRAVEPPLARRAADAEHARRHRRRRVHDPDGEEFRHRGHELLRADVRQRQPWCAAMAAELDRVRRAARLRIAELLRDQTVQHESWRRDSEDHRDRHRRVDLSDT